MNEIKCIFCEIESDQVVIVENGYKGKKCPQCGLIYISPRPSYDEIVNLYGHDGAHIKADSHISGDFIRRVYARHHLRIINSFVKSGALLDVGAGGGFFLDEARKKGFKPYGLEINPIQASFIRNKLYIPCEESPINTTIFEGKHFDVVYHCDVISHFFDPISDFKKINGIMRDGSFLIFETGNFGEVDQKYFKHIKRFQYPDHLFFFSNDNLINLLENTGFDFIKIYRYSILPQLKVLKVLSNTKHVIKQYLSEANAKDKHSPNNGSVTIKSIVNSQSFNAESTVKKIIKITYQYFIYLLRYKIGRIVLKSHRPQTVIVIARKHIQDYDR